MEKEQLEQIQAEQDQKREEEFDEMKKVAKESLISGVSTFCFLWTLNRIGHVVKWISSKRA